MSNQSSNNTPGGGMLTSFSTTVSKDHSKSTATPLNHISEFKERPKGFDGEFFDLLFNSAEIDKSVPEEKIKYHKDMTTERDIQNQIAFAEQKGIEIGFEQGVKQGVESTAKKMLSLGLGDDMVIKATGLSLERVAQLKEDNK